jgi:ubiquinone/menaquinone biosynthesis C-methylase UbiE
MPFGKYTNFDECVKDNKDKRNPEAYCAFLHYQLTGKWPTEMKDNGKTIKKVAFEEITEENAKDFSKKELLKLSQYLSDLKKSAKYLIPDEAKKQDEILSRITRIVTAELEGLKPIDNTSFSKDERSEDISTKFDFDFLNMFKELKPWQIEDAGRIISLLQKYRCKTVLHVGCGTGWLLALLQNWFEAVGVDKSESAVNFGRRNKFNIYQGYEEELPFVHDFFDAVITTYLLEKVDESEQVINEASRVAKRISIHIVPLGEKMDAQQQHEFKTIEEIQRLGEGLVYPMTIERTAYENAVLVTRKIDRPILTLKDYSKITLVPDFVAQVGEAVEQNKDYNEIEFVIKQKDRDEHLEKELTNHLREGYKDVAKYIYDEKGGVGVNFPLFDLALIPKEVLSIKDLKKNETKQAAILPKPLAFFEVNKDCSLDDVWESWCKDRKVVAIEPVQDGIRALVKKNSDGEISIHFDNEAKDRAKQFPTIVEEFSKIEKPFVFDCSFGGVSAYGGRVNKEKLSCFKKSDEVIKDIFKTEEGKEAKLNVAVLDVMFYKEPVMHLPYFERRKILDLFSKSELIDIPKSQIARSKEEFAKSIENLIDYFEFDKVFLKDLAGKYVGFLKGNRHWAAVEFEQV